MDICCAVVDTGRCHNPKAVELYLKYKTLCNRLDKLEVENLDICDNLKRAIKCYSLLEQAFKASLKHRRYAFVPECYDEGHNYR
jgi:hypothetical protein